MEMISFAFCGGVFVGRAGRLTGEITAPVIGSWGEPAWTARVPNPRWSLAKRGSSSMGTVGIVILAMYRIAFLLELRVGIVKIDE